MTDAATTTDGMKGIFELFTVAVGAGGLLIGFLGGQHRGRRLAGEDVESLVNRVVESIKPVMSDVVRNAHGDAARVFADAMRPIIERMEENHTSLLIRMHDSQKQMQGQVMSLLQRQVEMLAEMRAERRN